MTVQEFMEDEIRHGFIADDGTPLKCHGCLSTKPYKQNVKSVDGGMPSEYEAVCPDCGNVMGHWSYGSWDINKLPYCWALGILGSHDIDRTSKEQQGDNHGKQERRRRLRRCSGRW